MSNYIKHYTKKGEYTPSLTAHFIDARGYPHLIPGPSEKYYYVHFVKAHVPLGQETDLKWQNETIEKFEEFIAKNEYREVHKDLPKHIQRATIEYICE